MRIACICVSFGITFKLVQHRFQRQLADAVDLTFEVVRLRLRVGLGCDICLKETEVDTDADRSMISSYSKTVFTVEDEGIPKVVAENVGG